MDLRTQCTICERSNSNLRYILKRVCIESNQVFEYLLWLALDTINWEGTKKKNRYFCSCYQFQCLHVNEMYGKNIWMIDNNNNLFSVGVIGTRVRHIHVAFLLRFSFSSLSLSLSFSSIYLLVVCIWRTRVCQLENIGICVAVYKGFCLCSHLDSASHATFFSLFCFVILTYAIHHNIITSPLWNCIVCTFELCVVFS